MNIASILVQAGAIFNNKPAVTLADPNKMNLTNEHCLSYKTLAQRSAIIANNLVSKHQLNTGDRIALISANCIEYIELCFAVWHAGLVIVPINAKLHRNEFNYVLTHSGAKLCFTSKKLSPVISPLVDKISSLEKVITIASDEYTVLSQGKPLLLRERQANDPAWLFYTSGTTGKPKGAMLSQQNLFTMTQCYFSDIDQINQGDAIFHAAPMSHGSGFYTLPHLLKGGINIIPASGGFNETELLDLLPHYQNVVMFAAPTMVKRWLALAKNTPEKFSHLKTIIYGGAPMYQQDLKNAQQLLGNKLIQMYGQGECPMSISVLSKYIHQDHNHPNYKNRLASIGVAMQGVEIKIADAMGKAQPNGTPGEILVRSNAVMLGYFNDPAATAATLNNGWLKTGDMAIKNDDGFITLVDRIKDVIISGGSNIYPREIEEVLNQHNDVFESSVIGKYDANWGEIVVAIIVAKNNLTSKQLDDFCLLNMARFKRPKQYVFVDNLPKNNTGKILKTELRKQYG
jgi:long-chain acyl-CoA synthetase